MDAALALPRCTQRPKLGETLRFFGLLSGAEVEIALGRQVNEGGRLGTFAQRLQHWVALTYVLHNLNRSLGLPDGYPFLLAPPVDVGAPWRVVARYEPARAVRVLVP